MNASKATDRLKAIQTQQEQLKAYTDALERKVRALEASAFEEEYDVDSIKESKSYSLFLSLRGKLQERLEKEGAEALAVKLLLEQTKKEHDGVIAYLGALSQ